MARKAWLAPMSLADLEAYKTALYLELASVNAEIELKLALIEDESEWEQTRSDQLELPWRK